MLAQFTARSQDYDSLYIFRNCVVLDAKKSIQDERPDLVYKWLFGDGAVGHGQVVEHCYDSLGTYEVNLAVIDPSVGSMFQDEWLFQVIITEDYLLKIGMNHGGNTDYVMSANLISKQETHANFFWDFGDGSFGTGKEVEHDYDSSGVYEIRLLAQVNNDGDLVNLSQIKTISIEKYEN